MASSDIPTCRWGIITTGLISSWFVADLTIDRPDAKAKHIIQAIGASSLKKGQDFAAKFLKDAPLQPTVYGSYDEVYADPDVDCVYIGTPHSFHHRDCLAAIAAGKNVLCEKPFAINAREAREVLDAAKARGVYVAEAMWLRHRPMVAELRRLLFEERVIGEVFRTTSDFRSGVDIASLPATSRLKDLSLGAGSLLDIGIYPLTWAILTLDPDMPSKSQDPKIMAAQSFTDGIEVTTSAILHYQGSGRQGIISSTNNRDAGDSPDQVIATIDGTDGFVEVQGTRTSHPSSFTVYPKWVGVEKPKGKKYDYTLKAQGFIYEASNTPFNLDIAVGQGFVWEADNTALDIAAGRKESPIMPWSETIRVMEMMDEIRKQGGTVYPQDAV